MKKCRVILAVGETLSIVYTSALRGKVNIIDYAEYNCIDFINNGMIKDEVQVVRVIKEELNSRKKEYNIEGVSVLLPSSFYTEEYVTVENNKKVPLSMYFSKTYFKSDAVNLETEIVDWVKLGDKKVTTAKGLNKASVCLVSKLDSKKSFTFINLLIMEKIPVDHVMSPGLGVSNIATLTGSYEDAGRLVVFTGDTKTILVVTQSGFPIVYKEFRKGLVDLKNEICEMCKISYEEAAYLLKTLGVNQELDILDFLQAEREKTQLHDRYAVRMSNDNQGDEESSEGIDLNSQQPAEGLVFANEEVDVDDIDKLKEMQFKSEEDEEEELFMQKGFSLGGFQGEEHEAMEALETPSSSDGQLEEDCDNVEISSDDEDFEEEDFDLAEGSFEGSLDVDSEFEDEAEDEDTPALHLRTQELNEEAEEVEEEFDEDNETALHDLSTLLEDEVADIAKEPDMEVDFEISGVADEANNLKRIKSKSARAKSESKQKRVRQQKKTESKEAGEKKPIIPFMSRKNNKAEAAEQSAILFEEVKANTGKAPNEAFARLENIQLEDDLGKLLEACNINKESLRSAMKIFFKSYFEPIDLLINTCSEKDGIPIDTVSVISTDVKGIDLMVADYLSLNLLKIEFVKDKAVSKDKLLVVNTCEEFRANGVVNIGGSLSFLQKKGGF